MEQTSQLIGICEGINQYTITGWAFEANQPDRCVVLSVIIDNQKIADILCNEPREDVKRSAKLHRNNVGFTYNIPDIFLDGKVHEIIFCNHLGVILPIQDPNNNQAIGDRLNFSLYKQESLYEYISYIDGWKNGGISGWVQKQEKSTGKFSGNCEVLVTINGHDYKTIKASRYRGDVASALGSTPNCGFRLVIPSSIRNKGTAILGFFVMPDRIELQGSPYETSLIDDNLAKQIVGISNNIEMLYREIISIRAKIKELIPYSEYILEEYGNWAKFYFPTLPKRLAQLSSKLPKKRTKATLPLISVICPVYKPELKFFIQAVESVLHQTYQNWELLLIDDGGKSEEIRKEILRLKKLDPRIKSFTLKENKGISVATNVGLKKAEGEWIAFFDHDDLLVPEALEFMIISAQLHNAKMVYSDEDKIEEFEGLSEPNFKPDYNYRYLLGSNYICHLLMVKADILKQVGNLYSKYDGAQDHDLILRLTEVIPPQQIHHVKEVLYHWRKTPNSTAESVEHKQYAVRAGVHCVAAHLKRMQKPAKVSSINDITLYNVRFENIAEASVTIIIPFRDQSEITKRCLDAILNYTSYKNYRVILVDNASKEEQTHHLINHYSKHPKVDVIHINEEFNFARLNNLAVKEAKSDFYFFMNNDVFVQDIGWLNTIVNEALMFDDVGIVGGKLLYPNGLIQHGGVIVGLGSVAEHMHRGLGKEDAGYMGRALVSQELSAVTAAAMLIKADVFHKVGGFDETHLKVAYNDVDLCLKVREAGYKVIFCANFVAIHQESISRGSDDQPDHQERFAYETEYVDQKWKNKEIYKNDPAYSPYFVVQPQLFYELHDPMIEENKSL